MSHMDVIDRNAQRIAEQIISKEEAAELKRATEYRVSDAMREGASVAGQATDWTGAGDTMCAWSATIAAAKARGYQ